MSKKRLSNLIKSKTRDLKQFIDNLKDEPRIAWYLSTAEDSRVLFYLHSNFSQLAPPAKPESSYYPWQESTFQDNKIISSDDNTQVCVDHIKELPRLDFLPLYEEFVDFPEGSIATDHMVFTRIRIDSNQLGCIVYPIIYAFAENETFYCKKLIPNKATTTHIIHVPYVRGCGGGGKATGSWLLNTLKKPNCELFIKDGHGTWQTGDRFALKLCMSIPRFSDVELTQMMVIESVRWSGNDDVTFSLAL